MSDFLISLNPSHSASDLLELMGLPCSGRLREGRCHEFVWGKVCVARDPVAPRHFQSPVGHGLVAVVGDLVLQNPNGVAEGLMDCVTRLRQGGIKPGESVENHHAFKQLNGAFAIVIADENGAGVVTDPLGSVQVYVGLGRDGSVVALGTHPDLVACVAGAGTGIDPVSVFEFINLGTPCFPHTMYERVRELAPGRLHFTHVGPEGLTQMAEAVWWPFPDELDQIPDERELAASMERAFASAVEDRCHGDVIGVTLSGGLDSRLVMAAVPESRRCIGFTFCDVINREARVARQVARTYRRQWVPLFRDPEYVARTAMESIQLIGCEGDWVNAHGMGFVEAIASHQIGTVLTGLLMNNNVKGYYAADIRRVPRAGGLLPATYEIAPYDYVKSLREFAPGVFAGGLLESARSRRSRFLSGHPGAKRQSVAEWLDGYPFSQASDNTAWVAERRLMPVRLPAMDRRLLDLACRIPMRAKAGGQVFDRMAVRILGRGARIPNANDGVRPGSGHASRLVQRAVRKAEDQGRRWLSRFGASPHVPHSWHDYQRYWKSSERLRSLAAGHGENLREFEGTVFRGNALELLSDEALHWEHGFRLVQLALWRSIIRRYRVPRQVPSPPILSQEVAG